MWWIKASIQEYVLRSWSLVKMGTTTAQKKLFFNLKKLKNQIAPNQEGDLKKDQGPLGGVLSAMKWVKESNKDYKWISTFPVDTPFFKKEILQNFLSEINLEEGKLFFIKSNNTRHNIFGVWSIDLMDKLEEDLNNGERKVELWANSVGVKVIDMEFLNEDPFFNINSKKDLEKARKIKND